MKRVLVFCLSLIVPIVLFGCGQDVSAPTAAPTIEPVATAAATPTAERIEVADAETATPTPPITPTPEPTLQPDLLSGLVIGLDPGHQSQANTEQEPIAPDSTTMKSKVSGGTRGVESLVYEYEVNLQVALLLQQMLTDSGAVVIMTRTENEVNISNVERAELFNETNVDLAIRLHCNGSDDSSARGAFMLIPTRQRTAYYEDCLEAARCIIDSYCEATGLIMRGNQSGITERDDQTGFNWCSRPIVNIEMGHMTNAEEDLLLTDPDFQESMALGIYNGIVAYFTKGS
ncbi:MAG: N-acetylmuramoyl-L-alanine amidase [Clostridia bacterium]|nr:N-acetylmuramoyl-L-alanine amidase [Clostridia bacterium]